VLQAKRHAGSGGCACAEPENNWGSAGARASGAATGLSGNPCRFGASVAGDTAWFANPGDWSLRQRTRRPTFEWKNRARKALIRIPQHLVTESGGCARPERAVLVD